MLRIKSLRGKFQSKRFFLFNSTKHVDKNKILLIPKLSDSYKR